LAKQGHDVTVLIPKLEITMNLNIMVLFQKKSSRKKNTDIVEKLS